MNIIFIHTHFPGQFGLLAQIFGRDNKNNTVFITAADQKNSKQISGVKTLFFDQTSTAGHKKRHREFNWSGQAVARILADLKSNHPLPDLIIGHGGSGTTFYVKDVFPDVPFLGFFDWYFLPDHFQQKHGSTNGPDLTHRMELRHRNLFILSDLCACDHGICPTTWQKSQFPEIFHNKLTVVHPGVDTRAFQPKKKQPFTTDALDLTNASHIITCTSNALNSNPEFWQFMASLQIVLKRKPKAHIVIIGPGKCFSDTPAENKTSHPSIICKKIGLNPEQVHFLNDLDQNHYIQLLQSSSVHVCIDPGLMVSTAMLQAMACECLVMAPDIPSVREIITDGTNGIVSDFSTPDKISQKLLTCLDFPSFMQSLRQKARQTIVERYALEKMLPRHLEIIKNLVNKRSHSQRFG
ncbi:MAG: glycosyltransferase [Desulfotignum sp.]|nr:glycosyltransferase [Desulfotignum sp.]MCF8137950.1 glycosyltransferase [Desulfotignum sp.]